VFWKKPTVNFLIANLIRAFGSGWRDAWERITVGHLRGWGFNTIGNWSDESIGPRVRFPWVRPLGFFPKRTPMVFRDFPDVFHTSFEQDAAEYAAQLATTADDPALIGYFLMNEPTWGFASEPPAAGMIANAPEGPARAALGEWLMKRYGGDEGLSRAWGVSLTVGQVVGQPVHLSLTERMKRDLEEFSTIMIDRLFRALSDACKRVDPNHLNLGARYYTVPPPWALAGMGSFDVFSINCYRERIPHDELKRIGRPTIIGEWHFGAHDAGLFAAGIGRVANQEDRGRAYRVYVEDAATDPLCVGVHYFILNDQPLLGRFDGEHYQIGFVDICNRPYKPICHAARETHERLYAVARGEVPPFDDAPKYLPRVFC
jgi:hypothetical protein